MDWLGKLLDIFVGGLPSAASSFCPDHLKRKWLERLTDHNPFKTISANHDLVRATRLAWIEATQEVLKEARSRSTGHEWSGLASNISAFDAAIKDILLDVRDHALDRRKDPEVSPIDAHVQAVIVGVPELVSPGGHPGIGMGLTAGFKATLAELSGWGEREVPAVYQQIADAGLPTHGNGSPRAFGELVFAAFAEIIKDPKKYPQAREAFYIAMDKLGRDIGQATLAAVKGLDTKLDGLVEALDTLQVLRDGAMRYPELMPKIAEDAAEARAGVEELLRRTARTEGVPLDALRAILIDMGELGHGLNAGQVEEKLKAKAVEFKVLTERLNRMSNSDPEVSRLRRAAGELLNAGRFAQADAHLAAAEALGLDGLEDLETLARQKRLSAAAFRAERATAAKLRANPVGYRDTATHFGEAARISQAADLKVSRGLRQQEGLALIDLGTEFGLNSPLHEAIEKFRTLLLSVSRNADRLDWAATQNNLGTALWALGRRESSTARLEEAVTAYCAALEERLPDRVPLDWAATQNNLGNVLRALGERETGTRRLEEAVAAYRAALKERRRDCVPLDWATTQNNLGTALSTLGERESGTTRLLEAVTAYRSALEERQQDRLPLKWAATQNNLGNALLKLGERESVPARLEEAVAAYRAALEERRQDRVPLDWAMTQNNLGNALRALGERESGTARLEAAVAAFRAALEERRQDRVPLDWAMTQNNLANALRVLGERKNELAWLEAAIGACHAALEEARRDRVPLQWAMTQKSLGDALRAHGERVSGIAQLEAAVAAYQAALEEARQDRVPLDWAISFGNQGVALNILAARRSNLALARQALSQVEDVCEFFANAQHAPSETYYREQAEIARGLVVQLEGRE